MKKITFLLFALCVTLLSQAQVSKSLSGMTAGGLKAELSAQELTTVTNLTVTGVIDARDFKTMRDDMPVLEALDLSGVTIAEYTGLEGTTFASNTFPANELPQYAFFDSHIGIPVHSFKTFIFPSTITSIGKYSFLFVGFSKSLLLPTTLTSIGERAFMGCKTTLGTLTIPPSVITIGDYAFQNFSGLTGDLLIPASVKTLGKNAFKDCSGFNGTLTISSSITAIGDNTFSGCTSLIGSLIIPESVKTIGEFAFSDCYNLTGVLTLGSSIKTIGGYAFSSCRGLTGNLIIPASVTSIFDYAFSDCSDLIGDLTIPSSLTTINSNVFFGCNGLSGALTIPSSVIGIKEMAFYDCSNLSSISTFAPIPLILNGSSKVFYNVNKTTCILHVPAGSKALYAAANQWKDFLNIVEMPLTTLSTQDSETICIYPNPTTEGFKISGIEGAASVTLTDANGKLVLAKEVNADEVVSINALPSGVYVARVACTSGIKVEKIVKK